MAQEQNLDFESVWNTIVEAMKQRPAIHTLTYGYKNDVLSVTDKAIVVESHEGVAPRELKKADFREVWIRLRAAGQLSLADLRDRPTHKRAIIFAILATTVPGVRQVPGESTLELRQRQTPEPRHV